MTMAMDAVDRRIVNALQDGLPVCERPFLAVAAALDLDEGELIGAIDTLLECLHSYGDYGKRTPVADYPEQNRGGQGVYTIQMTERKGNLAAMKTVGQRL